MDCVGGDRSKKKPVASSLPATGYIVGDTSLANTSKSPRKSRKSETDNAEYNAVLPVDPDLVKIVAAWPDLPSAIRRAMLALLG